MPAWNALIEGLKAAATTPADAALVLRWLSEIGRWSDALAWSDSLPAAVRGAPIVADIDAEIAAQHDEIPRLAALLRTGAWGDWPANAQVLALASRVQMLHYGEEHARQTWADAIAASGDTYGGLRNLVRLAAEWRYVEGEELVLRRILSRDPKAFWAYGALRNLYLPRGDFPHLWELYGAWSGQLPDDPTIVSAWIMLGAVLGHTDRSTLERVTALQKQSPDSLPAMVAHAAALWRLGRPGEAWQVLSAVPPGALARADVSFWIALIQADLGHRPETVAALRRAEPTATSSAEKDLLRAAAVKVGAGY